MTKRPKTTRKPPPMPCEGEGLRRLLIAAMTDKVSLAEVAMEHGVDVAA